VTILQFPRKVGTNDLATVCGGVWTCGCGCQLWVLYENGVCLCSECNCISEMIANVVSRNDRAPEWGGLE
jgi:hypothetical protein